MYNPFDLIPKTIDKNLRDILIILIIIQFTAFLILISYLTYEFVKYKQNSGVNTGQIIDDKQQNIEENYDEITKEATSDEMLSDTLKNKEDKKDQ